MTDVKRLLTAINLLIFQTLLGPLTSLTVSHHALVMLVTITSLVHEASTWSIAAPAGQHDQSLKVWDSYFHTLLPVILLLGHVFVSSKERLEKESQLAKEINGMAEILRALPSGVALTVDFPTAIKKATLEARVRKIEE